MARTVVVGDLFEGDGYEEQSKVEGEARVVLLHGIDAPYCQAAEGGEAGGVGGGAEEGSERRERRRRRQKGGRPSRRGRVRTCRGVKMGMGG